MTHAFFKALLFMAAGSVISAMAGEQSLNRMSGFKRAMPFTYACFVIGGLALAGVPPFSGFFSKDEILADIGARGGGWWVFYVAGYVGAILTAIYTWRMIFRAFWGEPCPEARELEEGHLHHAEAPFNPNNGEIEDTDVGFPGPEHHIAERAVPMKAAMGAARGAGHRRRPAAGAVGRLGGRRSSSSRRSPTPPCTSSPSDAASSRSASCSARCSALAGIYIAYRVWVVQPGTSERVRERFALPAPALRQQVVLRRAHRPRRGAARGRGWGASASRPSSAWSSTGVFVGGTTGIVKAGSAAARALQNGFLRAYAALLVLGIVAVAFYFLIQSS